MNKTLTLILAAGLLTSLTYFGANADDPFGDDPFGSGPSLGNPFGPDDSDDPFGDSSSRPAKRAERNDDPFGSGPSLGNPFGPDDSDDPFGDSSSRPAKRAVPNDDPFGSDDDPFVDTKPRSIAQTTDDPFGGGAARPVEKARPAAPKRDDPFGADPFAAPAKRRAPKFAPRPGADTRKVGDKNASHARIMSQLDVLTTKSYIEMPLADVLRDLGEYHDIPIVVDARALEEIGLSAEEPVSLSLKNVTLRSFLRLMLRELDLTYMIKDEVMQITTIEAAEQNLITKIYRFPDDLMPEADALVRAINKTVVPDTWDLLGGPSSITSLKNVLIISTTSDVHDQISELLEELERKLGNRD